MITNMKNVMELLHHLQMIHVSLFLVRIGIRLAMFFFVCPIGNNVADTKEESSSSFEMNLAWDLCSQIKTRTLPSLMAYVHDNHNNENISLDTHNDPLISMDQSSDHIFWVG